MDSYKSVACYIFVILAVILTSLSTDPQGRPRISLWRPNPYRRARLETLRARYGARIANLRSREQPITRSTSPPMTRSTSVTASSNQPGTEPASSATQAQTWSQRPTIPALFISFDINEEFLQNISHFKQPEPDSVPATNNLAQTNFNETDIFPNGTSVMNDTISEMVDEEPSQLTSGTASEVDNLPDIEMTTSHHQNNERRLENGSPFIRQQTAFEFIMSARIESVSPLEEVREFREGVYEATHGICALVGKRFCPLPIGGICC